MMYYDQSYSSIIIKWILDPAYYNHLSIINILIRRKYDGRIDGRGYSEEDSQKNN